MLGAERTLHLIGRRRDDEPERPGEQADQHRVVQQDADTARDSPALQGVDAGPNRRRDDDREEEERHDEPPGPNRGHTRRDPQDDQRGEGDACRERTERDGSAVLLRCLVDSNTILNWQRQGAALTDRYAAEGDERLYGVGCGETLP